MEYQLIRSDRKTLYLKLTQGGELVVRAPNRCPKSYIDQFVLSKETWIRENQKKIQAEIAARQQFRPAYMGTMAFCGIELKVVPTREKRVSLDLTRGQIFLPDLSVEELRPGLAKVYKQAGRPYLEQRLQYWAEIMGISYGQLKLNSALRRWGSCTQDGNINITWFLMFAPERAIDYVLVHELAHRRQFNHSKAFWAIVRQYMPDYQQQKKELLAVQQNLVKEGWSVKS